MREVCPKCGSTIGIREIIYGLSDEPNDDSRFVLGGCCISDQDPTSTFIEFRREDNYEDVARILGS